MTKAKQGDTVKVHYTGKLGDGTVFDSSQNQEPLQFTLGSGQIIPGFEQAIVGMSPGESKTIEIPADEAFGQRRKELMYEIDRTEIPPHLNLEIGQELLMSRPQGQPIRVTVIHITEAKVTLDANHPLAGEDLTFDLHLVAIV